MFIKDIPANILFLILFYGGVAMVSLIACILLCFRKGNAFNADITPPVRLRRWAVAFFALSFFGYPCPGRHHYPGVRRQLARYRQRLGRRTASGSGGAARGGNTDDPVL